MRLNHRRPSAGDQKRPSRRGQQEYKQRERCRVALLHPRERPLRPVIANRGDGREQRDKLNVVPEMGQNLPFLYFWIQRPS